MKKRLLSLMLCTAIIVGTCACGNSEIDSSVESNNSQVVEESSSSEGVVEDDLYPIVDEQIVVTGLVVDQNMTKSSRQVWDEVAELTGVKIEWINIDKEALPTYLSAGDWPDFIHYNLSDDLVNDYGVAGGQFVNYLDYLEYMPNLQDVFTEYPNALKCVTRSNGEVYNLPSVEKSPTATQVRPYYRPDLLEKTGLPMPTTVDELYDVLVKWKEVTGYAGISCRISASNYWGAALYAAFGEGVNPNWDFDENGDIFHVRTGEQWRRYLTFMNKLYEEGLLHAEIFTMDNEAKKGLMYDEQILFLEDEAQVLTAADCSTGVLSLDVCGPLTSEYDSERKLLGQSPVQVSNFYINKDCSYVKELCQVFDIMFADEEVVEGSGLYGVSFGKGLENIHWRFTDETKKYYEIILPEGYEGTSSAYAREELIWIGCGLRTALGSAIENKPGSNGMLRQQGFVNNVFPYMCDESELLVESWLKFTEEESEIIANIWVDLDSYMNEMTAKFVTGVVDIDTEWDKYVETVKSRNIDAVCEVYQNAWNRFNEK